MVHIISVSISDNHKYWLEKHRFDKSCSPTFLLRKAVNEKMQEMGDIFEDYKKVRISNETLKQNLSKALELLRNDESLFERYLQEN